MFICPKKGREASPMENGRIELKGLPEKPSPAPELSEKAEELIERYERPTPRLKGI